MNNLQLAMDAIMENLGTKLFAAQKWGTPNQLRVVRKCSENRKSRAVAGVIFLALLEEICHEYLLESRDCAGCSQASHQRQLQAKVFEEYEIQLLRHHVRRLAGVPSVEPPPPEADDGIQEFWAKRQRLRDIISKAQGQSAHHVAARRRLKLYQHDDQLLLEGLKADINTDFKRDLLTRFLDDNQNTTEFTTLESLESATQLLLCRCNTPKKVLKQENNNDETLKVVMIIIEHILHPALVFHAGIRKDDRALRFESRAKLFPVRFAFNRKFYRSLTLVGECLRLWAMTPELAAHFDSIEVMNKKGLDEDTLAADEVGGGCCTVAMPGRRAVLIWIVCRRTRMSSSQSREV